MPTQASHNQRKPVSAWLLVTYRWRIQPWGRFDEPTVAMERFRRKALDGDLDAFYQSALTYRSEFNDAAQAMKMLREAAEHGHPAAIYELPNAMWHGAIVALQTLRSSGELASSL